MIAITTEKQKVYKFYNDLGGPMIGLIIKDDQLYRILKIERPNSGAHDHIATIIPVVTEGDETEPREIRLKYDATVFTVKASLEIYGNNFKQQGWEE